MTTFEFRVKDRGGVLSVRQVKAAGVVEAVKRIRSEGEEPVSYRTASVTRRRRRRLATHERILFYRGLGASVANGTPLVEAISLIGRESHSPGLQAVLSDLARQVGEGTSLDEAMATWPTAFTPAEVTVVRSAWEGGALPEALSLLADYREVTAALTNRVTAALIYPVVIGAAILGLLLFFVGIVLPEFVQLFTELGLTHDRLPAMSRGILWIHAHSFPVLPGLLISVLLVLLLFRVFTASASGRIRWDYVCLRVPLAGPLLYEAALSRATSLLGVLLRRNVPLLESLRLAAEGAGNAVLAAGFGNAAELVAAGERLSTALQKTDLFPEGLSWRVAVAERAGDVGNALHAASAFYTQQTQRRAQAFSAVIEPVLIIFLGIVVGSVVVASLSPLFLAISGFCG